MKILSIIVLLFVSFGLSAQDDESCFCVENKGISIFNKKNVWKNNNKFLLEYIQTYPQLDSGFTYFRVPIVLHIFLNPNEKSINLFADIKVAIQRINRIYAENNTGIQFYIADIFLFKQEKYLTLNYYTEAIFATSQKHNQLAINVYYVNALHKFQKEKSPHGLYNSFNKSIVIIRHASETTLAHEVGHFFGLIHPHENWKKGKRKQESVSRIQTKGIFGNKINCEVNGDGLSDTPAEPELIYFSDENCNYTGEILDKWEQPYSPNVNNIMSYPGTRSCRTNFTTMQKAVMLFTAANKKQSDIWRNCPDNLHFTFDEFEPDDRFETVSEMKFNEKQYHTFHKSISDKRNILKDNNLDFLTFTNSSTNSLFLNIEKGNYDFPEIQLTIFDRFKNEILSVLITTPITIPLKNLNGKYFIRMENKSTQRKGQLFDYQVEITN